ncbi:MAG: hypothetical protein WC907_03515 [Acholeplasmataceae bacterium]
MLKYAISQLKLKKNIIQTSLFFIFFLFIYLILDYLNYRETTIKPSNAWIVGNVFLDLIMALLSALLMTFSTIMVSLKTGSDKASNLGFLSILFGIFTYGCTGCVVVFFSAIGIAFSPTIFPLIEVGHGILYKFLSLLLIMIGFVIVGYNILKGKCKIKLK